VAWSWQKWQGPAFIFSAFKDWPKQLMMQSQKPRGPLKQDESRKSISESSEIPTGTPRATH